VLRPPAPAEPAPPPRRRRPPGGAEPAPRATAESLAQKQREISVSEFFVKNRHLLGFDNPSKALLTTIKEAVDNSLDACEEAGILPSCSSRCTTSASRRRSKDAELTKGEGASWSWSGQRARHRQGAGAEDLRQAASTARSSTA
jgi:DNA topoisomerase-6 subunit B